MLLVLYVALVLCAATATEQAEGARWREERRGEALLDALLDVGLEEDLENQLEDVSENDDNDEEALERDDSEGEESGEEEEGMESRKGGCRSKGTPCKEEYQGRCRKTGERRRGGYAIMEGDCPEKCPYCFLKCATNSTDLPCSKSGATCRGECNRKEVERQFSTQPCFYEGCKCCVKCGNSSTECEEDGGICRGEATACKKRNRYMSDAPCVEPSCVCCKPCEPKGKCAELDGYCTSRSSCKEGFTVFAEDCTSSKCICCARE